MSYKRTFERATNDAKKREIVERLLELWKKNPSMRLGQLIGNCSHYPSGVDPYHWEDYDFISILEEYYASNDLHN